MVSKPERNIQNLASIIDKMIGNIRVERPLSSREALRKYTNFMMETRDFDSKWINKIREIVKDIDEIKNILKCHRRSPMYYLSEPMSIDELVEILVVRSIILGGGVPAVLEFINLASKNIVRFKGIALVSGLQVNSPLNLTPEIKLLPIEGSEHPKWITRFLQSDPEEPWARHKYNPITALVEITGSLEEFFTKKDDLDDVNPEKYGNESEHLKAYKILQRMQNCLAIYLESPVIFGTTHFDISDERILREFGGHLHEQRGLYLREHQLVDVLDNEGAKVFEQLHKFPKKDSASLDIAMSRIISSMCVGSFADRALDLGVALEVILMKENSSNSEDNQEISNKIALRAAWLVGKNLEERMETFKQIKKIYTLRSKAAHTGQILTKSFQDSRDMEKTLTAGSQLGCRIVRRIVRIGCWPLWINLTLGEEY